MEAGEENNASMKRQRTPLSDSEDNVFSPSDMNDGQKRRRLDAAGQENRSPKPSSSGRLAELGIKADTPMVPSVQSRVHQLTHRREEAPTAPRCFSDPGAESPVANVHDKGFREHLLGEGEFSQRMGRFKVPVLQTGLTPSPSSLCSRTRSNLVSDIHQKLQGTTTPSSKQASRIRQERDQEISQLHFQPISENAWLKRSSSDPLLAQQGRSTPGPSSHSSWVPRSGRRVHWPPMQPRDDEDEAEKKDGSFSEVPTSAAENPSANTTGQISHYDSEAPLPVELKSTSEGQLQIKEKENTPQGEEVMKERDHKTSVGDGERLGSEESKTVLKLSFSEDQSFSKTCFSEDPKVSCDEDRLLESTFSHESNNEKTGFSKAAEQSRKESFLLEEDEKMDDDSLCNDEYIEPSTDEECRSWRYPQYKVCKEGESVMSEELQEDVCAEEKLELSGLKEEKGGNVADHSDPSEVHLVNVSFEMASYSELQENDESTPEEDSVADQCSLNREHVSIDSNEEFKEGAASGETGISTTIQDQKDTEECTQEDDFCQQSEDVLTIDIKEEHMDLESGLNSRGEQITSSPSADVAHKEIQTVYTEFQRTTEEAAQSKKKANVQPVDVAADDPALSLTEVQVSECSLKEEKGPDIEEETHKAVGGECLKKVTFILEPELINDSALSEARTSEESRAETSMSDAELSSHDETNTNEIIDQMFDEVLEYAGRMAEERGNDDDPENGDSGIGVCSGDQDKMDTESKKEKSKEEGGAKEEWDESKELEGNGDELLTFPPSGILSPLSKSVEAWVTPLRLTTSMESNPPSMLLTPEETVSPFVDSVPLYSIDAYRTQRQNKLPPIQSVTPGVQRRAPEKSQSQHSVNTKERIMALNEEAVKLQSVISQTLQALSCCTDEEHGRGSLEEAEAEKLLLVSCEKRSALLAEVSRLREERNSETGGASGEDKEYVSQQPCRGTVSITNIQLPLKFEFVCSSQNRTGRPSHYFFILIRYGPCNIIATPLATVADAQNGDTISFPTSVTLKDIRSSFEIDVEVYSLSHTSGSNCSVDRTTTKSRVTPRKLLNTIKRSSNTLTSATMPALNARCSSNFCLVGSHNITLASLGHSKFPLDKMKLDGKIRRLLGDEFQEKVPFLSPLEGNIYLRLDSQSHSNVQHQGFLTMFELVGGFGVWHRRYFVLEGYSMHYWNHPNDSETKQAGGSISLASSPSQCVRPVKRDSCARPFTFELVSNIPHQQQDDSQEAFAKCWFSADTKQERSDWMEKLTQVLLDVHTWNRTSATKTEIQQSNTSSGNLRESIL
ncbi:anillin, actin binding protein 2 isoform X3 [Platichthys flesus]|uniref:anillin, actin binding protein 2 isoform X3 n=1 Tax=Platichthys flesus TaxID=8260 RepID=UPI002DBFBF73|nr:anillin, actin binding protein 2 isoform X3 [Platichthys flesus]